MATSSLSYDYRPLSEAVDRSAARQVSERLVGSAGLVRQQKTRTILMVTLVGIVVIVGATIFLTLGFFRDALATSRGFGAVFLTIMLIGGSIIAVLAVIAAAFSLVRVSRSIRTQQERWFRLAEFASRNGMTCLPAVSGPDLPGLIFERAAAGSGGHSVDVLRVDQPRFVEFGNFTHTQGSGDEKLTEQWGYVAIRLENVLPHILLDARSNNAAFGPRLGRFDRHQKLSLEGGFDDVFQLYCPAGYESDALYLFTPDIMQQLMQNAAELDVELVDNWVFFYSTRDLVTLNPATWERVFALVTALIGKLDQWERWRDDKLNPATGGTP